MSLFGTSREQIREVFFRAWKAYRNKQPVTGMDSVVVGVALRHPEYHSILDHPDQFRDRDFLPETGQVNPFLHMGMHITIEEQISVDQPRGVLASYRQMLRVDRDEHVVQHKMMECLGEMLQRAQERGGPPDEEAYLDCLARLAFRAES